MLERGRVCSHLLDERKDVLHHALEHLLVDCIWANGKVADDWGFELSRQTLVVQILHTILDVIIDGIVLRRKLFKE
jgi:hypothetical protein